MIGFTKERIEQFIKNPLEHGLTRSEQMEMARQMLAVLEQEPVAWPNHCDSTIPAALRFLAEKPRPIYGNSPYNTEHLYQLAREIEAMARRPLYAAPQLPQPVVISFEEWSRKCDLQIELCDPEFRDKARYIWDESCRAAMPQGAESVQGWIPCSERMPDTMISVLVTGDWFHHGVSFWDGASWCDLDFEPPVTHWMPLPAAPQQEVEP